MKRRQVLWNNRRFPGRGRERQRRMLLGGGLPLALPPLGQRGPDCKAMTYAMAPGALSRGAGRATNSPARCPRCIEFAGKIPRRSSRFSGAAPGEERLSPPKGRRFLSSSFRSSPRLAVDLGLGGPAAAFGASASSFWEGGDVAARPARASLMRLFRATPESHWRGPPASGG